MEPLLPDRGGPRQAVVSRSRPNAARRIMSWAFDLTQVAPFIVATTEAPSYRRVALERMREEGNDRRRDRAQAPVSRGLRDSRWQWNHVCLQHRRPLPRGLPSAHHRQRPPRQHGGGLSQLAGLPRFCTHPATSRENAASASIAPSAADRAPARSPYTGDPLESDPFCAYEPKAGAEAASQSSR